MDQGAYPLKPLVVGQPGRLISAMSRFSTGVRDVADQIPAYTQWWDNENRLSYTADGPVLAVIGDSSALGIGASHPSKGYVQLVRQYLSDRDRHQWGVANLAKSGAKVEDALERQLVELGKLAQPDLVICCVGSNDIFWSLSTFSLDHKLKDLVAELPEKSLVAALAGGSPRSRASNRMLKQLLEDRPHTFLNPWAMPDPSGKSRLAEDKFHPNDFGYELIAKAFTDVLAQGRGKPKSTTRI